MKPRTNDEPNLHAQLAEKNELVVALTEQLEKTATQLDRLKRSGADRLSRNSTDTQAGTSAEVTGKLAAAIDEWQEFQPAERIERIEDGIDRILELLTSQQHQLSALSTPSATSSASVSAPISAPNTRNQSAPGTTPPTESGTDFWTAAKARILGNDAVQFPASQEHALNFDSAQFSPHLESVSDAAQEAIFPEFGPAPEPPEPVQNLHDPDELQAAVKSREAYIQYLTVRLRSAESSRFYPVRWELLAAAPNNFQGRLESLETLLKDQLRQAEIANSLERALLGRERAKLSQIKQNLEIQIRRMVLPTNPALPAETTGETQSGHKPAASNPVSATESKGDSKGDSEGRWKRIFSR